MKSLTEDWLNRAKDDLAFAENFLADPLCSDKVVWFSRQSIEKSFRAVAESRNIEIPAGYSLFQLGKLAKNYAPEIDIEIVRAPDDINPSEAADFMRSAKHIFDLCARISHHENINDDSIWDSQTLLYF